MRLHFNPVKVPRSTALVFAAGVLCSLASPGAAGFDATVYSGGARLYVHIEDERLTLRTQDIVDWIQRSSDVVSAFYGRFPVAEAYVAVIADPGSEVLHGVALGGQAAVVNVRLGFDADARALAADWVLVHELIHLGFPKLQSRHHWAEEGVSVYVESVARVQAGDLAEETMWRRFVEGMPNGLPRDGDLGLDDTPTWGAVYWGGALFFLLADVEIIRRSGGDKSLRDALRGVVDAGLDITSQSDLPGLFRIADAATGLTVLSELYARRARAPVTTDLDRLWRQLGVERIGDGVVLVNDAEFAEVRRTIVRPAVR